MLYNANTRIITASMFCSSFASKTLFSPSGGIFGSSLQTLSEISKEDVPEFVLRVTGMVEKNIKNVGIYRQSGDKNKIDRIKKKVGKNKLSSLDKYKNDTAELACVLKQFFRELKEPLIPQEVVEDFVSNYGEQLHLRIIMAKTSSFITFQNFICVASKSISKLYICKTMYTICTNNVISLEVIFSV